jgi:hypothetical protein
VTPQPVGPVVQSFFVDGLSTMRGLRPSSVRSYRVIARADPSSSGLKATS